MMEDQWMALARDEEAIWFHDKEKGGLVSIPPAEWAQTEEGGAPQGVEANLAREVRANPSRYQRIPLSPEQELADARAFVPTILSGVVQRKLEGVLSSPRALDRFRRLLARYPDELARWRTFRAARLERRIQEWLHEQGAANR